jgi:hypothetical protein
MPAKRLNDFMGGILAGAAMAANNAVEGLEDLAVLFGLLIGGLIIFALFQSLGGTDLLKGLPLLPGQKPSPAGPGGAGQTQAVNPADDVKGFLKIFDAADPVQLWENFSTWFQQEFGGGGSNSGTLAVRGVGEVPLSDGSAVTDYIPSSEMIPSQSLGTVPVPSWSPNDPNAPWNS